MTMYYVSEFCRICLQNDPNLIDIMKIENEPNETLLTKLKLCVSEVEWSTLKVLMCNSCIRRLNSSYDFKKQCLRSAITLKNYLELVNESQIKSDLLIKGKNEQEGVDSYVPLVPNQKVVKIVVPSIQSSSFQNVFLNVIPPGKTVQNNGIILQNSNTNGSDQAIFYNLNNFQKSALTEESNKNEVQDINVSDILRESTTEELSIEIDPTDFSCVSDNSPTNSDNQEVEIKDWEEVISGSKILPVPHSDVPKIIPFPKNIESNDDAQKIIENFVPILPKPNFNQDISMEEKYEFFNSGHFLTSKEYLDIGSVILCETCNKSFDNKKMLHHHIKQFHCGKFPYHCEVCSKGFASKVLHKVHMQKHAKKTDNKNKDSLTLQDFVENGADVRKMPVKMSNNLIEVVTDNDGEDGGEHKCESCTKIFNSANGLLRHKVRKHKSKARKKYFIKGQKNAKCDICNREFSTNSYMNMHKKLHLRHGADYKGKVFKIKSKDEIQKDEVSKSVEFVNTIKDKAESDSDNLTEISESATKNSEDITNQIQNIEVSSNDENPLYIDENKINVSDEDEDNCKSDADKLEKEAGCENTIQEIQLINIINIAPFHDFNSEQDEFSLLHEFQNLGAFKIENSTQCMYCNKVFSRKHDLKRHLNNIHLKSIQFKCHLCNNTFYEAFHLTRHLRAHYTCASCTICQKMFSTETDMTQHNEMVHDNMALWQCGVCYVMFNEPFVLKQHMTEHQGPIIYRCHLCDGEFGESRDLSRHIIEHSGMYSCRICQKNFGNEHEKITHDTNTHGPTKKYECDLCPKSYKKMHELTRHRNLHLLLLSQEKKNNIFEKVK